VGLQKKNTNLYFFLAFRFFLEGLEARFFGLALLFLGFLLRLLASVNIGENRRVLDGARRSAAGRPRGFDRPACQAAKGNTSRVPYDEINER
jgi:hypothetical protein